MLHLSVACIQALSHSQFANTDWGKKKMESLGHKQINKLNITVAFDYEKAIYECFHCQKSKPLSDLSIWPMNYT